MQPSESLNAALFQARKMLVFKTVFGDTVSCVGCGEPANRINRLVTKMTDPGGKTLGDASEGNTPVPVIKEDSLIRWEFANTGALKGPYAGQKQRLFRRAQQPDEQHRVRVKIKELRIG